MNSVRIVVGIRQAALYTIQYCNKASFTQVMWLTIGRAILKNAIQIQILKKRKSFIYPNTLQNDGKLCPVSLIVCYLSLRYKLGHNSDNDYLLKGLC